MCGIIGIVGKRNAQPLDAALTCLSKRGPDDHGTLEFPNAILGQTRLAIIDLSPLGHQPMQDNTCNIAITFNGEIYNYKELRTVLEKEGHRFSTQSDTEVILKCYLQYGHECVKYLDGMFAFALWDEAKQELFMARDRFGKKPLYWAHNRDGAFVVGSEIKALFAAGVRGVIDPAGIDVYLTLRYSPPWRTVYENVHTISPAHTAVFKDGALTTAEYWKLEDKPLSISYGEATEELKRLFTESSRKRMIADVEVGALLSGGVDSTLVTGYAQKFSPHPLKTFSLGYGDLIDELPYAEAASKAIGTDHHTVQATSDLTHEFEEVLTYFDEPRADSSDFPQHLVSALAASKVKVALSGDGGDELFLGYRRYWYYWHVRKVARVKNLLTSNPFKEYLRSITVFPAFMRRGLLIQNQSVASERIDRLVADDESSDIKKMSRFDLMIFLPGQLLAKVDQASMMHSLEVRCPFLDHHLAEFAFNLPEEYKTDRQNGKLILKDWLAETMPREFVYRRKRGFGAPIQKWLSDRSMRAYMEDKLGRDARLYQLLRPAPVKQLMTLADRSPSYQTFDRLWLLLCLEIWLRRHEGTFDF